jgi:hypothetical protein
MWFRPHGVGHGDGIDEQHSSMRVKVSPSTPGAPPFARQHAEGRDVVALLACPILTAIVVRTAWVGDDAYITFRTIDNLFNGYGLRWNVAERVQTYTHPLWLGIVAAFYFVTGEPYYTALAISMVLTVATMYLLVRRIANDAAAATGAAAILILSKAFIDFSTSGLGSARGARRRAGGTRRRDLRRYAEMPEDPVNHGGLIDERDQAEARRRRPERDPRRRPVRHLAEASAGNEGAIIETWIINVMCLQLMVQAARLSSSRISYQGRPPALPGACLHREPSRRAYCCRCES